MIFSNVHAPDAVDSCGTSTSGGAYTITATDEKLSDQPATKLTPNGMSSEDMEMRVLRTRGGEMGMERGDVDVERDAGSRTDAGAILEVLRSPLSVVLRSPTLVDVEHGDGP